MKPLTNKEKALFTRMDVPVVANGKKLTRSVVITYCRGRVVGVDSVTAWRRFMKIDESIVAYTYELRNMWV